MGVLQCNVALRKESVDRNSYFYIIKITGTASLSARRAWIEIPDGSSGRQEEKRRSPQGERG